MTFLGTNRTSFAVASAKPWGVEISGGCAGYLKSDRYRGAARHLHFRLGCGGSIIARSRRTVELQKLADEIAMPIKVCHYPPGTSK
jgi:Rhodopirellula transposase DDE domain